MPRFDNVGRVAPHFPYASVRLALSLIYSEKRPAPDRPAELDIFQSCARFHPLSLRRTQLRRGGRRMARYSDASLRLARGLEVDEHPHQLGLRARRTGRRGASPRAADTAVHQYVRVRFAGYPRTDKVREPV